MKMQLNRSTLLARLITAKVPHYRRLGVMVAVLALLVTQAYPAVAETAAPTADWLEPRGINVVDLVGLVPEDHLKNAILVYETGRGLLQYESGQRTGDTVVINTRVTPRYFVDNGVTFSQFSCLGQPGVYDQWPSPTPASTLRVFDPAGAEITANAVATIAIASGQNQPSNGTTGYLRYPEQGAAGVQFAGDGSIVLPANQGCKVIVRGQYNNFRAQFTVNAPQQIQVTVLGSETFNFRSYIGAGASGNLASLNSQMQGRYGTRHDKFQLSPPAGSEFILVNYPPTPIDPYAGTDAVRYGLAGSGTYRLEASGNTLSVDHLNTMGLPIYGQWQDVDQSGGDYLKFFSNATRIGSPEYFLPPGVAYNACMTNGGCPESLLEQINNTSTPMSVYYYNVERIVNGLTRVPLRQVGDGWRPGSALVAASAADGQEQAAMDSQLFLPVIFGEVQRPDVPPDDASGCPCGWFTADGRMVDYIRPN